LIHIRNGRFDFLIENVDYTDVMRHKITWLMAGLFCPFFLFTGSHWSKMNHVFGALFLAVGICLLGVAVVGRLWCSLYIAGWKHRVLITEGPYSLCRNPLYLFSFIGALGIASTTQTLTFPIMVGIIFFSIYQWTIREEEAQLLLRHESEYEKYFQSTSRIIPRWKNFREPETVTADAAVFRRHCVHVSWFPIAAAGSVSVQWMKDLGWLPTFIDLY